MAYFSGNPILAKVTVGTFPSDASNKRLVLIVTINGREYKFMHEAESGKDYTIDVSSAYRSELAMKNSPTPLAPTSQTVTGSCSVYAECMVDGEIETVTCGQTGGGVTARLGRYTEIQRINGTSEAPTLLTNKPSSVAEVVGVGETVQYMAQTKVAVGGMQDSPIGSPYKVYGESGEDRHTLYFLNQYGEIESVSLIAQESLSVNVKSSEIGNVRAPQAKAYATRMNYHTGGNNVWKMSSGYLTREWLQWFAHDVMMSDHYWLKTKQGIIPVLVTADESMNVYDKASGELKAINVVVESVMEGVVEV